MFNFITVRGITSLFIAVISYTVVSTSMFFLSVYCCRTRVYIIIVLYSVHVAICYSSLLHDTAAHIFNVACNTEISPNSHFRGR
jgi:hypothetical protein